MSDRRLVERTVADFVQAVASTEEPTPAAGSVSALTGAASAALLELACGVTERHTPGALSGAGETAGRLRRELLDLVDEDAAAFRALLDSRRGSPERRAAAERVSAAPLAVARACVDLIGLADQVGPLAAGEVRFDARAARELAASAARAALALVQANLPYADQREALEAELARLHGAIEGVC